MQVTLCQSRPHDVGSQNICFYPFWRSYGTEKYLYGPYMVRRRAVLTCWLKVVLVSDKDEPWYDFFEGIHASHVKAQLRNYCCLQMILSYWTGGSCLCAPHPHFPYLLSLIVYYACYLCRILSLLPLSFNPVIINYQLVSEEICLPTLRARLRLGPCHSVSVLLTHCFCHIKDVCCLL